eukprot:COSAG06_NODE_11345_length_1524_cov_1.063158_2_plen_75_part_00
MSSDEEYTNSEEENDEIAELPEIDEEERAKIAARGGKRRAQQNRTVRPRYMTPAAADLGTISVRCRDRFYSALK